MGEVSGRHPRAGLCAYAIHRWHGAMTQALWLRLCSELWCVCSLQSCKLVAVSMNACLPRPVLKHPSVLCLNAVLPCARTCARPHALLTA